MSDRGGFGNKALSKTAVLRGEVVLPAGRSELDFVLASAQARR